MDHHPLFKSTRSRKAYFALLICLVVLVGAVFLASQVQTNFGKVEVSNVTFDNTNGIGIRAKLLRPVQATASQPAPGLVYVHGYQNNRETSDAYCIELSRRGFVMLCIDAIGRGNSGNPNDIKDPTFDPTYGTKSAFTYLKTLPFVKAGSVGVMGHSLGAEMAYTAALSDPSVQALSISGFAYRADASPTSPKNMLMIYGKYDEYRQRMTGTNDFTAEWMNSPQTKKVIPAPNPQFGVTYGNFKDGSARRVFSPPVTHIEESHNVEAIAEAVDWMRQALQPNERDWVDARSQIWMVKEWATLIAMLAGMAALLPLGLILLRLPFFADLRQKVDETYACTARQWFKHGAINGAIMLLYLPLVLMLFAVHLYVVPIDKVFPMMMVNGVVFWFLVINIIGFFIFRAWFKKQAKTNGLTRAQMGVPALGWSKLGKAALLALGLFAFAYLCQALLEAGYIVDYRFLFPFASDLTPYRWLMALLYFPFLLAGFLQTGIFLHGQLRLAPKASWWQTFLRDWGVNMAVLIVPILFHLAVQYVPLFTAGVIPFVGPGAALVGFVINLLHMIVILVIATLFSTWFFHLTGNVYLGAVLNALIVTWMFASSQVIAPIPV